MNESNEPAWVEPDDLSNLGAWAFRSIWLSPRETIRRIVEINPGYQVNLLIALGGIAESLEHVSDKDEDVTVSLPWVLGSALIIGPVMALILAWIYTHLNRIAGSWMGGQGDYEEIKAALGWSAVPTVVGLALWVPLVALFGEEVFAQKGPALDGEVGLAFVYAAFTIGLAVLNIWSIVLLCHCLAEVQGYESAWKGLGNIVVACVLGILPMALLIGFLAFLPRVISL
jgi:hypothetical protein